MISKELTGGRMIPYSKIQQQIVKSPDFFYKRLRTQTKIKINKLIQEPEPLKYKLNEYDPKSVNTPTKNFIQVPPFYVYRTFTNNLPVYSDYANRHEKVKTIIRHITGDVTELAKELEKITSGSSIKIKTGRIEIDGLHSEKVKLYLSRLGF